jgi:hypothetical protein
MRMEGNEDRSNSGTERVKPETGRKWSTSGWGGSHNGERLSDESA